MQNNGTTVRATGLLRADAANIYLVATFFLSVEKIC